MTIKLGTFSKDCLTYTKALQGNLQEMCEKTIFPNVLVASQIVL